MLGTISPLGERARGNSWHVTTIFYVGGTIVGGVTIGAVFGLAGSIIVGPRELPWILAIAIFLGVVWDAGLVQVRLPSTHRQVNDVWVNKYRGWAYGFGFGIQLGAGVLTIVKSTAIYLVLLACALSGGALAGALLGGLFGLLRGMSLLLAFGNDDWDSVMSLEVRLQRLERPVHWFNRAALVGVAIAILVVR